jgi:hypothetical protein
MKTTARRLVAAALLIASTATAAQRSEAAAAAVPPAAAPVEVDGHDVSKMSQIEDASLEGLLGLSLEDQLGQTESASRSRESVLRAPATITTIDATQIRLSGATTVADVLRFVPGVTVIRNSPSNYVISLRGTGGLAANNVILTVDGIPLNDPLDGTVSWDLVPLNVEDVERIEVVRGPVSPAYGADAYTGVINILTRQTIGLTPSYVVRARGGADARGDGIGSVSTRFVHIGQRLELKGFLDAGHDEVAAAAAAASPLVYDGRPTANHLSGMAALKVKTSRSSSLAVELGGVWSRRSGMDHLALDSESETRRLFFGRALFDLGDLAGHGGDLRLWAQSLAVTVQSPHSAATGFSYDGARTFRVAAGTDLVLPLAGSLSLQLGGQGWVERVEAPFLHPNASGAVRPGYGFYTGLKAAPLPSLDLILTGRGDLAPIAANLEYSYRASAIYHRATWALRLTGASAFRTPTYVEAAGRFVDPTSQQILLERGDHIVSPRNTAIELGATFSPSSRLTVAPTVYVSRLSNLIVEDFESLVRRTFLNSTTPRTLLGGELEANWRIRDSISLLPSFTILQWLDGAGDGDTNVGVPSQNSRYVGGLRIQGLFGNDRWGYGIGATVASPRSYHVRAGIPPVIISSDIPTTARLSGMIERQLLQSLPVWGSLRVGGALSRDAVESPLPLATPMGQSAILGVEIRRE